MGFTTTMKERYDDFTSGGYAGSTTAAAVASRVAAANRRGRPSHLRRCGFLLVMSSLLLLLLLSLVEPTNAFQVTKSLIFSFTPSPIRRRHDYCAHDAGATAAKAAADVRKQSTRKVPFYGLLATVNQSADSSTTASPSSSSSSTPSTSFIDTELRGAAMRLHTKSQAPREGQAPEPRPERAEPYVTTLQDYLQFLVDSQAVFQTLEDVVKENDSLSLFRDTGLERTQPLEHDIVWMCDRYHLKRPGVGGPGLEYSQLLRTVASASVPQFVCHWYNFYFAHTAGGRMIGKQMSNLLLDGATLEFYQWKDGDLAELKSRTKRKIDDLAASWTPAQRQECVDATLDAFAGGAAVNSHLSGGGGP
jgi:heme oxygenase